MTTFPLSPGFKRRWRPLMVMCLSASHLLATTLPLSGLLHLTRAPGTGVSSPRWMREEGRTHLCPILTTFRMGGQQIIES